MKVGVTSNSDMVASSTRAHFLDLDIISRFILSFPPFLFFFHPTLFFSSATFIPFLQHYNHHRHYYYYYYSLCIYPLTFLDGERVSCCSSRQVVISQWPPEIQACRIDRGIIISISSTHTSPDQSRSCSTSFCQSLQRRCSQASWKNSARCTTQQAIYIRSCIWYRQPAKSSLWNTWFQTHPQVYWWYAIELVQ